VVAHGLRHQKVNDGYQDDCGSPSPVRGGTAGPLATAVPASAPQDCSAIRGSAPPRPTSAPRRVARKAGRGRPRSLRRETVVRRGLNSAEAMDYLGVKRRTFEREIRPRLRAVRMGTSAIFSCTRCMTAPSFRT
jgi:hypothetical protein